MLICLVDSAQRTIYHQDARRQDVQKFAVKEGWSDNLRARAGRLEEESQQIMPVVCHTSYYCLSNGDHLSPLDDTSHPRPTITRLAKNLIKRIRALNENVGESTVLCICIYLGLQLVTSSEYTEPLSCLNTDFSIINILSTNTYLYTRQPSWTHECIAFVLQTDVHLVMSINTFLMHTSGNRVKFVIVINSLVRSPTGISLIVSWFEKLE